MSRPRRWRPSAIGYPVMLKATAGGGGIGMRRCEDAAALRDAFAAVDAARRQQLRRWRRVPGALRAARPPYRSADLRRRRRAGRGAGRARLLAAASQPEGDRGGAGARRLPAAAARPVCAPPRCVWARAVALPVGRHGGVSLDAGARRVLLPRGQHPAAGGAWRDRAGDRRGPGRMDGPRRRRRAARSWTSSACGGASAPRSRRASMPRIRRRTTAPAAAC